MGVARRRSGGRLAAPRESCWRELERAGPGRRGAGQGPEVGKGPTTALQNGQVGVWEIVFVPQAGPRTIPKSAIIDERGNKISEDLIYFCDLGSPFSEKICWICCKGSQILASRYLLAAASGSYRQLAEVGQPVRPGTYLPHAPGVRMM